MPLMRAMPHLYRSHRRTPGQLGCDQLTGPPGGGGLAVAGPSAVLVPDPLACRMGPVSVLARSENLARRLQHSRLITLRCVSRTGPAARDIAAGTAGAENH